MPKSKKKKQKEADFKVCRDLYCIVLLQNWDTVLTNFYNNNRNKLSKSANQNHCHLIEQMSLFNPKVWSIHSSNDNLLTNEFNSNRFILKIT